MTLLSEPTKEILHEIRIFIKEIGFPIGVAIWLLWQAHTSIKELNATLYTVSRTMIEIEFRLKQLERK